MFIMLIVFLYDDTFYLLNVYVQSIGYYLQWIIQLGAHTGNNGNHFTLYKICF